MTAKPDISLFFPVYNDERTIRTITKKALDVVSDLAANYEVLIVDDGSPDRCGEIADELARTHEHVRVIHHGRNLGYGAAIQTGLRSSRYEWICFTDGDDEYDVNDLYRLIKLRDYYDLIITFRYVRLYSGARQIISRVYNTLIRQMFRTNYRDISTGLRLVRRSLVEDLDLSSKSPFVGAELTIKAMLKGYRIGEVGIQTFPRKFGTGASTSMENIVATVYDMLRVHRSIFSPYYDLQKTSARRSEDRYHPVLQRQTS